MRGRPSDPVLKPANAPHCDFLMQVIARLDDPLVLADAPLGTRRILYASGGTFSGPDLEGQLLPGGGDWVLMRRDGVAELDIRLALSTGDAQLIYLRANGIFHASPQIGARIRSGEEIDPAAYYFRTSVAFETGAEKYGRLNRLLAIGIGRRTATGMVTDIFAIK
jgi:Protein of unknown function (DUF3237)